MLARWHFRQEYASRVVQRLYVWYVRAVRSLPNYCGRFHRGCFAIRSQLGALA